MRTHEALLICLLLAGHISAAEPPAGTPDAVPDKDRVMEAYNLMEMADNAKEARAYENAVQIYSEALDAYMQISADYPDWQAKLVQFRIAYCRDQLRSLLGFSGGPDAESATATSAPPAVAESTAPPPLTDMRPAPGDKLPTIQPAASNSITHITTAAKALLKNGEFVKARVMLMDALETDPDSYLVRLLIGVAQCEAGKFHDAALLLRQLSLENPSDPNVHVALAGACFGMGENTNATKELATAIELKPEMSEAHYNMAQILLTAQPPDTELAADHYKKALELGATPDEKMDYLLTEPLAEPETVNDQSPPAGEQEPGSLITDH